VASLYRPVASLYRPVASLLLYWPCGPVASLLLYWPCGPVASLYRPVARGLPIQAYGPCSLAELVTKGLEALYLAELVTRGLEALYP